MQIDFPFTIQVSSIMLETHDQIPNQSTSKKIKPPGWFEKNLLQRQDLLHRYLTQKNTFFESLQCTITLS